MTDIHTLRASLHGQALEADDPGYHDHRRPWNLTIDPSPTVVIMAESAADIQAAVRFARDAGSPLAVQSTGHGAVHPCDGVVVNLSRMAGTVVDTDAQVARVTAGTKWRDVLEAAAPYGLAGLSGTAAHVGAVGYTLGGGVGLLLRSHGFAADTIVGADVVTADGGIQRVDEANDPDLLWALKGGSGNFGVVTTLDVQLFPVTRVVNGMLAYPGERADHIVQAWAAWTKSVGDDVTSAVMLLTVPPAPEIPEALRGRRIAAVRATVAGADSTSVDALRDQLGEPLIDTFQASSYFEAALSGMEPEEPSASAGRSGLVTDLSSTTIERVARATGDDSAINMLEIRHLGGQARHAPEKPSSVAHRDVEYLIAMHAMPGDAGAVVTAHEHMDATLDDIAADVHPGAHINFMNPGTTPDEVRRAYEPQQYTRLRDIKRRHDPDNVFRFNHNIPPAED